MYISYADFVQLQIQTCQIFILGRKFEILKNHFIPYQNKKCKLESCVKEKKIQKFQCRIEELLNYLDKLKLFVFHILGVVLDNSSVGFSPP